MTHGAFLRGINLGRQRRVSNEQLRASLAALGLREVAIFRASGNVVFESEQASDEALRALIEEGLERALGYEVPTYVRSAAEIRAIAQARPFEAASVRASSGKLHVALLHELPAAQRREQVLSLATAQDRLAFGERELYWLPRGRMRDSGLELRRVEALAGAWTMRTKATIEQLAAKHLAA